MQYVYKEVRYDQYCKTCVHRDKKSYEEPCDGCLNQFARPFSRKPAFYEKDENPLAKEARLRKIFRKKSS